MAYLFALIAAVIAYIVAATGISTYMEIGTQRTALIALQGLAHGLTMLGLAGVALSFTPHRMLCVGLMALGAIGLCGGLVEDVMTIVSLGDGWKKDTLDGAQRFALLTLLYLRFVKA